MPKPDVSDQRKTQILEAARRVFSKRPYEEVSVREIAKKAALSVGGVYWYFKSKEEILAALLRQNAENNIVLIQRLLEADAPVTSRLQIIFEQVVEQVSNLSQLYLTGAKYHAMLSREPETVTLMEQIGVGYRAGLTTLIEQGIERGEFQPVNAAELASAMIGMYEGVMLLWVMSPQNIQLKETMLTGAQLMLAGLTKKEK